MNIQQIIAIRNGILVNASVLALRSMKDICARSIVIAEVSSQSSVIDTLENIESTYNVPVRISALLANPLDGGFYGISNQMKAFLEARDFDCMQFTSLTDTSLQALDKQLQMRRQQREQAVYSGRISIAEMIAQKCGVRMEDPVEIDWSEKLFNAYGEVKVAQRSDDDETGTRMVSFKTGVGKMRYPVSVETGEPVMEGLDPEIFAVDNINPDEAGTDEQSDSSENMESFSMSDKNLPQNLIDALNSIAGQRDTDKVFLTGGGATAQVEHVLQHMFGKDNIFRV